MTSATDSQDTAGDRRLFAPLRHRNFSRIWLASFASNFGALIQSVGAAWTMTELTPSVHMVALVQTAAAVPMMLFSLPAGAVADIYDRRTVGIAALIVTLLAAALLSVCAVLHLLTPLWLLAFSFMIGCGMAVFTPTWQSSVAEQVPAHLLPQAVSLNSISFNVARSFGPGIGGVLVALGGGAVAFIANTFLYLPMIAALAVWRRARTPPRLPPEQLFGAMISGVRYVLHAPTVRAALIRVFLLAAVGGVVPALTPLVARDLLHGDSITYGLLLGAFGVGAVIGALSFSYLRTHFEREVVSRVCKLVLGLAAVIVGLSHALWSAMLALCVGGAAWMMGIALYNIAVQLTAPRWVAGRMMAMFSAAIAAGMALGGVLWGGIAEAFDPSVALIAAGAAMLAVIALTFVLKIDHRDDPVKEAAEFFQTPDIALSLTPRSGPIVITIEYRVLQSDARAFYGVMQNVRHSRQRSGAYGWSLARDVSDPELWSERYHCPTWADYQRQRNRLTHAEREVQATAWSFHRDAGPPRIRRELERPFGSVRLSDDTPDPGGDAAGFTGIANS